jgi:hypothetical protein
MENSLGKKIKLKGKTLTKRLTGISCPVAGVSWTPPPDEQDIARRLLVYLEDRRVLFAPYTFNRPPEYAVKSILEIRQRLTKILEEVGKSSVLGESLVAMRAASRAFLDQTQRHGTGHFENFLGELRAHFGIHIAKLACAYDLEVDVMLATMLPPEVDG